MAGDDDKANGEAFFSRWSRRKQSAARADTATSAVDAATPHDDGKPISPVAARDPTQPADAATAQAVDGEHAQRGPDVTSPPQPLSEDDFKDVDFTKLDYQSDYGRFMQQGVPETIRQKALAQLWNSDTIFTQVDPFQDYAGDYTDAATVPIGGIVKTAYRVGQGFLSDDEAHAWDRLNKPDVAPEIAALPVLRPGYRVRRATPADAAALTTLRADAIRRIAVDAYGADLAERWASAVTAQQIAADIAAEDGAFDVAIDDNNGAITAVLGRDGMTVTALFTAPGHGRRGLARRLIERTIQAAEAPDARGYLRAEASALSKPLFERLGFRVAGATQRALQGEQQIAQTKMERPLVTRATFSIADETPDQPDVRAFFAASEAYMGALYPAESNHFVDAAALAQPNVVFLLARLDGVAVACGAIVMAAAVSDADRSGEIKRMWVAPARRGLKLGWRVLEALEATARRDGLAVLRLETGIHQPEAIALYRRAGFQEIGPFGDYAPDPLSIFMEKRLARGETAQIRGIPEQQ